MEKNMPDNNASPADEVPVSKESIAIRFCPICGAQMHQGMRYGLLCWICPECDFDEPV
ncbi:zf-TFIIB domain-containing protein [Enterobacter asburiae]|uniref:zf-TFIIB domain-containing protein n=1 Tax=Enterobacter asburiae TaxID=61645 RepID=UPI003855E4A9